MEPVEALNAADVAWMLMASSMVLFMTPGLAFFYGGMVSAKNVISTMLQCFIALGLVSVLWIVVGFSLSFGDSIGGLVGNPLTFKTCRMPPTRACRRLFHSCCLPCSS